MVKSLAPIVKLSQGIEEFDPELKAFADSLLISLDIFMDLLNNITEAEQTDKQAEEYLMKSMVSLTVVLHAVLEPEDFSLEKIVGKFLAVEALDHLGKLLDKVSENSSYIMELKTLVTRMKDAAKFLESEKKLLGQFMYAKLVHKIVEEMRQLISEIYGNGIASYAKKIETLAGTMNDKRLDEFLSTLTRHMDQPPESKTEEGTEEHIPSNTEEPETPAAEIKGDTEEHIPSNTEEPETPAAEIKEAAQSQTFNETFATFLVEKLAQLAHLLIPEDFDMTGSEQDSLKEDAEESIPNNTMEPEIPVAEMNGQMRQALLDVLGLHVLDSDSEEFSAERMLLQSDILEHLNALIKEAAQYKDPAESVVEKELKFILESWNNIPEIELYSAVVYLQELLNSSEGSKEEEDGSGGIHKSRNGNDDSGKQFTIQII